VACNDTGCRIVSTGTTGDSTDDHFKLASAATGPNEVMMCTDEGCFEVDASTVNPDHVTPVCDDGRCVLTPDGHHDVDFCRTDGVCYSCGINAAHIAEVNNIDMTTDAAPDYSNLSFSERLKMMCAEESKNGLTAVESGPKAAWSPTSSSSSNGFPRPRRPAPRRPTTYQTSNYATSSSSNTRDVPQN